MPLPLSLWEYSSTSLNFCCLLTPALPFLSDCLFCAACGSHTYSHHGILKTCGTDSIFPTKWGYLWSMLSSFGILLIFLDQNIQEMSTQQALQRHTSRGTSHLKDYPRKLCSKGLHTGCHRIFIFETQGRGLSPNVPFSLFV